MDENQSYIHELGKIILYLMACALNEVKPDAAVYDRVDDQALLQAARFHMISAMIAFALESNHYLGISEGIQKQFNEAKNMSIRKNMLLNNEREKILALMEKEKIKYLPLKGIVLQNLYPKFGMRQMSDNDILYDSEYQMAMKTIMEKRGFQNETLGKGVHDTYFKAPVYNFEMHTSLFSPLLGDGRLAQYYSSIWQRAIQDEDHCYGYHLSNEDFYIYVTAHAKKHFASCGTGLRSMADFYVMHQTLKLDSQYVNKQLNSLDLTSFEKMINHLADQLLSNPAQTLHVLDHLSEADKNNLDYILTSGTYGTLKNGMMHKLEMFEKEHGGKMTPVIKCQYYLHRLFPKQRFLIEAYPLARYKVLIPAVWVYRGIKGIILKRDYIFDEIKTVQNK